MTDVETALSKLDAVQDTVVRYDRLGVGMSDRELRDERTG